MSRRGCALLRFDASLRATRRERRVVQQLWLRIDVILRRRLHAAEERGQLMCELQRVSCGARVHERKLRADAVRDREALQW